MAAAVGTPYSPSSPPDTSSSATMSPVYPDRPIRPLPRRSLRERLSPEVAEQIPYPSASQTTESVINFQYGGGSNQRGQMGIAGSLQDIDRYDRALIEAQEDYEDKFDRVSMFNHLKDLNEKGISFAEATQGIPRATQTIAHSVTSSADSVDGYDSFENTNNKKKRKIPLGGALSSHPPNLSTSLSNDLANMGLHARDYDDLVDNAKELVGQYYGSTNTGNPGSGTGISGAGRGRFGRSGRRDNNGRAPLSVSGNAGNLSAGGRTGLAHPVMSGQAHKEGGIISAAIAEAATSPVTPSQGQENVSLLDQYPAKHSAPVNTQFTFTCESDASKTSPWPQIHNHGSNGNEECPTCMPSGSQSAPANHASFSQKGFSTQGTQTSPVMGGQQGASTGQGAGAQQAQNQPRKPRRSPSKRYALAARERRRQQEYENYHRPPRLEDIWICEYCEYELIFGVPPSALVRQYEIKDLRERKRLAEKRRLLEKAKMKGRKGKKGSKNSKNNAATQPHTDKQQNPVSMAEAGTSQSQATQSDEYHGDDYDDDEIPIAAASMPMNGPSKAPPPLQHARNGKHGPGEELHNERKT